jgi:hypothetical protein
MARQQFDVAFDAAFNHAFDATFDNAFDNAYDAPFDVAFDNAFQNHAVVARLNQNGGDFVAAADVISVRDAARVAARDATRIAGRVAARNAARAVTRGAVKVATLGPIASVADEQVSDLSKYASVKSVAQGLFDVGLFVTNATFLHSLVEKEDPYYFVLLLVLLIASLICQFIVFLILLRTAHLQLRETKWAIPPHNNDDIEKINIVATFFVGAIMCLQVFIGIWGNSSLSEPKTAE